MDELGVTVAELIAAAERAGDGGVTRRQVERWHKAQLLPRRRQHHIPGRRGSVGVYPPGTVAHFLALCRLRREKRRLDELRFWLWWEGHDVPDHAARATLARLLPSAQRGRRRSDPDPLDRAEAGAAAVMGQVRSPLVRRFRRGLRSEEDVLSALVALLLPAFGGTPAWGGVGLEDLTGEAPPEDLLFRGLGLGHAAADAMSGAGPWLPDGAATLTPASAALGQAGAADAAGLAGLVAGATEAELAEARADARFFAEELPEVAAAVEASYGRGAFGFGALRSFGRGGPKERTACVAACLALRRLVGPAPFAALRATVRAVVPQAAAVLALCRAFPRYAAYFGPDGAARLASLPEEERERVAADVRAYLAATPTLRDAMGEPKTLSP